TAYQWLDLDGEGSPGVLAQQAGAWFYKRNLSNLPRDDGGQVLAADSVVPGQVRASFDALERVAAKPSPAALAGARQQFCDLAGEGRQCLVQFGPPMAGFYERNDAADWEPFSAFAGAANIDWTDPNLRSIDLDGDGRPDVLITEHEVFTWYRSLAKD